MSKEPNNIEDQVLKMIHAGKVSMHSRAHFQMRTVLISIAALILFLVASFALSFIFFSIHETGEVYLLEFSKHGLLAFLSLFPWIPLFIFLGLLMALEFLVRHFAPVYRRPLLFVFLWIVIAGIIGGFLIELTPINDFFLIEADKHELPILGPIYEQLYDEHQEQGVYRGVVQSIGDSYFFITYDDKDRDTDEGTWPIVPPKDFDLSTISLGEKLYVGGKLINGIVYAYGIHQL